MRDAAETYNAGSQDSGKRWSQAAWDYSDLMYDHFGKEEEVLFRMADNVLSAEEQAALASDFEKLEKETIDPGRHEQLYTMMAELVPQNGRR